METLDYFTLSPYFRAPVVQPCNFALLSFSTLALWCNPLRERSCTGRWTRSSPAAVKQNKDRGQEIIM